MKILQTLTYIFVYFVQSLSLSYFHRTISSQSWWCMLNFLGYSTIFHELSNLFFSPLPPTIFILEMTEIFSGSSLPFFVAQGMSLAFSHCDPNLKLLLSLDLTPSCLVLKPWPNTKARMTLLSHLGCSVLSTNIMAVPLENISWDLFI